MGGKVEEDVFFLLLWVGAIWKCVNLELRDRRVGGHAGHPWESVTSFSCSWKTLMSNLVLEVVPITSAIPTAWRSGKPSSNLPLSSSCLCWLLLSQRSTERHWVFSLCRIKIEEEYAKNLAKLSQNSLAAQEEG